MSDDAVKYQQDLPVAIIGMSCYFPKSVGLKDYWGLIRRGEDAIIDVPATHWSPDDYFDKNPKTPDHTYCKRGGFIPPINFDPTEFGIPPNSLEATDTSQLLGLLAAKTALADAGYDGDKPFNRDRTSVILGVTGTQELVIPLGARLGHPQWRRALNAAGVSPATAETVIEKIADSYVGWQENSFPGLLGNVVAGRICNRLDLGGTNCVVDAACASSMSAVNLALLELYSGRSDMVVTGGVDTLNDIFMHMCFSKTHILSPTGDVRPFSENADGTVLGEGIGILIFKRLDAAEKDGDRIYAVIRGIGASSDGKSQSIYAPSADGQTRALRTAYRRAGVSPSTVALVETHGTGTKVGDRVEFEALKKVFAPEFTNGHRCAIGSVKSMIGHTKAAAGAAGIIKTALALHHKILPPTLKAEKPDPKLDIENSPFYLNTQTQPWFSDASQPRRSGVSSFGFGGSNFHIVLEEYQPSKSEIAWDGSVEIIALSAASLAELNEKVRRLTHNTTDSTGSEAFSTAATETRRQFSHRDAYRLLWIPDPDPEPAADWHDRLKRELEMSIRTATDRVVARPNFFFSGPQQPGKIAFMFPGQGSQYVQMGCDLVCSFPDAFKVMQTADSHFKGEHKLTDYIYPAPTQTRPEKTQQIEALANTGIAQPAIGSLSLAMFKILKGFDVIPDATCGHSFGELTALLAAGWMDEDTFHKLAVTRGRLMATAGGGNGSKKGGMLAVKAPIDRIEEIIRQERLDVVLANRNSPDQGVVSGSVSAIAAADKIFRRQGFNAVALPVSAAFHSPLMGAAGKPFEAALKKMSFSPADVPVYSNTTAQPYPADARQVVQLLAGHLLNPVNFSDEIENLYQSGVRTFVEVGPKSILSGLTQAILADKTFHAVAMDRSAGRDSGITDLARTLCYLSAAGHPVALGRWERHERKTRKALMHIPISGANYRSRLKPADPSPPSEATNTAGPDPENELTPHRVSADPAAESSPLPGDYRIGNSDIMQKKNTPQNNSNIVNQALDAVQQGLQSMQSLQQRTAAAHQKFLETQQEASKTLQLMMESTRRLAQISLGQPPAPSPADEGLAPRWDSPAASAVTAPDSSVSPPETASTAAPPAAATADRIVATAKDTGADQHPNAIDRTAAVNQHQLSQTMLDVVSDLTGYPPEMIDLDMNIEADLGIDSIKRVEILSSMEERIPELPAVSPEVMGQLKTLRQILALFSDGGTSASDKRIQPDISNTEPGGVESQENRELQETMLQVVSDLTGYPVEMIDLDMDIEGDLGIDSIKRVEILSTLEEKMPALPSVSPDMIGSLKTLGQIIAYLKGGDSTNEPPPDKPGTDDRDSINNNDQQMVAEPVVATSSPKQLSRRRVKVVERPLAATDRTSLPAGRKCYITDDKTGLSQAIADELAATGINTVLISADIFTYKSTLPAASGLVIVHGADQATVSTDLADAFRLARNLGTDLLASATEGRAIFGTVSRMDGAFGFNGRGVEHPLQGALAGLAKTADLEWGAVRCRAIDVAPTWKDQGAIAKAVVDELLNPAPAGPVEVGLDKNSRVVLDLVPAPIPDSGKTQIALQKNDVIVVTGGGRGVTAAAACALAAETQATLVLLGRSPAPVPEPVWLAPHSDEAAMKKAILDNNSGLDSASPRQLTTAFKKYMANRQLTDTLEKVKATGATAVYYPIDVREAAGVKQILADVRKQFGPVRAIIHGAGVLRDRLIVDKKMTQFETVFDTKVDGLRAVLEATQQDPLKYLVIFSSVTARMGNRGQADYAMANEALNKMAQQLAARQPETGVVSINWGPWDGGMVTPALKREFERNRIGLIPIDRGVAFLLDEMKTGDRRYAEVVVGRDFVPESTVVKPVGGSGNGNGFQLTFKRQIDVRRYPVLRSHVLDGKPVVPLALMTEWFGHGALHDNPGLHLHGFDDVRVLQGIKLDEEKREIRLLSRKTRKNGSAYEVSMELRDGYLGNAEVVHSRAKALLVETAAQAPAFTLPEKFSERNYSGSIPDVYKNILFHGADLQGIREISHLSGEGMVAGISTAPAPSRWMQDPLRNRWLADPLVLDSAFQMAIIWCHEQKGTVSLPSYYAAYRQYRDRFPENGVIAVLEVKNAGEHRMQGDFVFLDADHKMVAKITGYEAVMDQSLYRAFKS